MFLLTKPCVTNTCQLFTQILPLSHTKAHLAATHNNDDVAKELTIIHTWLLMPGMVMLPKNNISVLLVPP